MATKQVILTENLPGLGAEADLVTVKAGFANNHLLPKKMAFDVTPSTLRELDRLKAKRAEREARELQEAEDLARKISKLKIKLTLETGETGKAFGSVTAQDLSDRLKGELGGTVIDRHKIAVDGPIKTTGDHEIPIKLHPDVTPILRVQIKSAAAEEAEAAEEAKDA